MQRSPHLRDNAYNFTSKTYHPNYNFSIPLLLQQCCMVLISKDLASKLVIGIQLRGSWSVHYLDPSEAREQYPTLLCLLGLVFSLFRCGPFSPQSSSSIAYIDSLFMQATQGDFLQGVYLHLWLYLHRDFLYVGSSRLVRFSRNLVSLRITYLHLKGVQLVPLQTISRLFETPFIGPLFIPLGSLLLIHYFRSWHTMHNTIYILIVV